MDPSAPEKNITAKDPFATDIFAAAAPTPSANAPVNPPLDTADPEPEKRSLWFERLPQVAPARANWDELQMKVAPQFGAELSSRLADSLAVLLDSPQKGAKIEFLLLVRREINHPEDFVPVNSQWWLSVGIEGSKAEIAIEIDEAFAVWLVDAALGGDDGGANTDGTIVRELTPGETVVVEFLSLNLAYSANQILGAPIFRFRSLNRHLPAWLSRKIVAGGGEAEPSLLVVNWQTVHGVLPSVVKMYLSPEALHALQPGENRLLDAPGVKLKNLPHGIKDLPARLSIGSVELSYGEIAALEKGDIVLPDNLGFAFYNGIFAGQGEVFLGAGETFKITGEIIGTDSGYSDLVEEIGAGGDNKTPAHDLTSKRALRFRITDLARAEKSARAVRKIMVEANDTLTGETTQTETNEQADDGGGLAVENLSVNLRVELDARRLSLAEVVNLRENQTIDLGVRPTDAVNLLIDNQLVGRGELVAFEDRLGVRITKLLR